MRENKGRKPPPPRTYLTLFSMLSLFLFRSLCNSFALSSGANSFFIPILNLFCSGIMKIFCMLAWLVDWYERGRGAIALALIPFFPMSEV